jgi:DNA repair photolyase
MKPIYTPKGAALEYGDFAINIYDTCNHGCYYCYAKKMYERFHGKGSFCKTPEPRKNIVEEVRKQLENEKITGKMIHLCFTCDPYPAEIDTTPTREIIKLLKAYGNHVQILTKGGRRAERDFDLLDENDRFGVTYCGYTQNEFMAWHINQVEPNAESPMSRVIALASAHAIGIKTWVSIEPVLLASDVLEFLSENVLGIDLYRIGKLNYHPSSINWHDFGHAAEEICKRRGLTYYIKDSLRAEMEKTT